MLAEIYIDPFAARSATNKTMPKLLNTTIDGSILKYPIFDIIILTFFEIDTRKPIVGLNDF